MEQQNNIPDYSSSSHDKRALEFVRKYNPYATLPEALEAYAIYRAYRDEGQGATASVASDIVSRQYAGLL